TLLRKRCCSAQADNDATQEECETVRLLHLNCYLQIRKLSILELAVEHHFLDLVACVQHRSPEWFRMEKHLATFRSDDRLTVHDSGKDVPRPKTVVARRLILLDEDTLAAACKQVRIIHKLVSVELVKRLL